MTEKEARELISQLTEEQKKQLLQLLETLKDE